MGKQTTTGKDNEKLDVTLIDFDNWDNEWDMKSLEEIRQELEAIGAKEKSAPVNISEQENNNNSSFNLPSWVLPAFSVGLLAFSLANLATVPLALAAVPLLASIFPSDFEIGDLMDEDDQIRDFFDRRYTYKLDQELSQNEKDDRSFYEKYPFLLPEDKKAKDDRPFYEKYPFLLPEDKKAKDDRPFYEKYPFLLPEDKKEKDNRPLEEKYPFLFEQKRDRPLTFDDVEERFIRFLHPGLYQYENVVLPDDIEGDEEENNSQLLDIARKWDMPKRIPRWYLENILWDFGMPIRAIKKVSLPGLWLLYRLYFRMQIGREISSYHDDNLAAKAKETSNILEMFSDDSNKPEFVYVYNENERFFQIIPLSGKVQNTIVDTNPNDPLEPPWDNVEYVDNVIILDQSIPIFKVSKKIPEDFKIVDRDVNPDSPIIKYASQFNDPNITEEQILNDPIFHPYHAADGNVYTYEQILQRIEKAQSNQLDLTAHEFRAFGYQETSIYRPERREVHDQIIGKIFDGYKSKVSEHPTFIALGGRGGSGKSSFEGMVYDREHYLLLDMDRIKAMLPEYDGYNASSVHKEAYEILLRALTLAIKLRVNVVLDATMNTLHALKIYLPQFKEAGYHTEAHYMFVPRQETAKRGLMRFLDNPNGRYVPIQVLLNMKNGEKNFDVIKDMVDAWSFIDNNVPYGTPPKLIAKKGTFSYSSYQNLWDQNTETVTPLENQSGSNTGNDSFSSKLPSWVLPTVGVGLLAFTLGTSLTPAFALASLPFLASIGPMKIENNQVKDFVNLRKQFVPGLFKGKPLHEDEAQNMQRILGEETFGLWQDFYNKDLSQIAQERPEYLAEIIKYSNCYETFLPSRMDGTNPLYIFGMKKATDNLINNLLNGQKMESVIGNLGKDINNFHLDIARIKLFNYVRKDWPNIDWKSIENITKYMDAYTDFRRDLYSGLFRESNAAVDNHISDKNYPEYLQEMLAAGATGKLAGAEGRWTFDNGNTWSVTRLRDYRGVLLSNLSVMPEIGFATVGYPRFFEQKNKFFKALQENYDNIEPIINNSQSGQVLTEKDIKTLHENIAEISYIFTSVMPFWRGSASANLALVYGLYEMAGIDAPPLKIGRSFDLSAFASTPEEYKANWLNLFDGEFEIKQNVTSAQVLFTDDYKNKDIPKPTEDMHNYEGEWVLSHVDICRGMTLGTYDDLKGIFNGLSSDKVRVGRAHGKIYFSNVINIAVHFSKMYKYGHIPVVIISDKDVSRIDEQGSVFFDNFSAEDIKEVLVWAEIDGKLGWWKAELDENGEVILKYADTKSLKGYGTFNIRSKLVIE